MTTRHHYPRSALVGDYVRGGAGVALMVLPLALLDLDTIVAAVFGVLALVFAVHLLRTVQRQVTVVETGGEGIVVRGPLGSAIRWDQIAGLRLKYYSTRRDRQQGWMNLTLRGGGRKLSLESSLTGFDGIAERAAANARANGVALDLTTLDNLGALGIDPAEEPATDATDAADTGNDDWIAVAKAARDRARDGLA